MKKVYTSITLKPTEIKISIYLNNPTEYNTILKTNV
jgi:hypothetical protein